MIGRGAGLCGRWQPLAAAWAFAAAFVAHQPVWAGRGCEQQTLSAATITQAMSLAEHTAKALDASGAKVVLLARVGQDLSRWHQHYSHMAWAYRDEAGWRVVHKLNDCGTDHAGIYRQGLAEFVMDDLFEFETGLAVPSAELQARLLPVLKDNQKLVLLHEPRYSMVSYPWAQRYQQSNQWALETLALAMDSSVINRTKAQDWLRDKGYVPDQMEIPALTRLGARLTKANVAFDDHPNELRFAGHIRTITADSVFRWLNKAALAGPVQSVR